MWIPLYVNTECFHKSYQYNFCTLRTDINDTSLKCIEPEENCEFKLTPGKMKI